MTVRAADQLEWIKWLTAGFPEVKLVGLPLVAACAVVGNYSWENDALPLTKGKKDHGSDGGGQWRLDRLGPDTITTSLQGWCRLNGFDWTTIKGQAAFTLWELSHKYKALDDDLRYGHKSLASNTANFMDIYEVPAPATANLDARIKFALRAYTLANSAPVPPPVTPAPVVIGAGLAGFLAFCGAVWSHMHFGPGCEVLAFLSVAEFAAIIILIISRHRGATPTAAPVVVPAPDPFSQLKTALGAVNAIQAKYMADMQAAQAQITTAQAALADELKTKQELLSVIPPHVAAIEINQKDI